MTRTAQIANHALRALVKTHVTYLISLVGQGPTVRPSVIGLSASVPLVGPEIHTSSASNVSLPIKSFIQKKRLTLNFAPF